MNADSAEISFTDIGIVDLDLKKTTWSRVHSAMRTLYLGLSRAPDLAWTRFFHEERESRIVIKRHGLWIEDDYIVFDCLLPDVERHHLPDFRLSIAYANRKSHELAAKQVQYSEEQRRNTRAEQRRLAELRDLIRGAELKQPDSDASPQPLPGIAEELPREHWAEAHDLALASAVPTPVIDGGSAAQHELDDGGALAPDGAAIPGAELIAAASVPAGAVAAAQARPQPSDARDEFDAKRTEWRTRFRAALTTSKESDRGND